VNYLLDTSALLAGIWEDHQFHPDAMSWLKSKAIFVCPLSALGFLRISTHPGGPFNASMSDARKALETFIDERKAGFIPDDLPALDSSPDRSSQVTDAYLADLAAAHAMRLATLDGGIKHAAVEVIEVTAS